MVDLNLCLSLGLSSSRDKEGARQVERDPLDDLASLVGLILVRWPSPKDLYGQHLYVTREKLFTAQNRTHQTRSLMSPIPRSSVSGSRPSPCLFLYPLALYHGDHRVDKQ